MRNARNILMILTVFALSAPAWAHKPLISVEDNEDGTIYVEVGFSDGSSGSGNKIIIYEKSSGKVLSEHTVPDESCMDLPMPKVPYTVEFNAGPGHDASQDGPFSESATTEEEAAPEKAEPAADAAVAKPTAPPAPAVQPVAAPVAATPVVVTQSAPVGAGAEMAMKMMLTTQLAVVVLMAGIFGIVAFWAGFSMGKSTTKSH